MTMTTMIEVDCARPAARSPGSSKAVRAASGCTAIMIVEVGGDACRISIGHNKIDAISIYWTGATLARSIVRQARRGLAELGHSQIQNRPPIFWAGSPMDQGIYRKTLGPF
jgi:hypothetical protein